MNRVERLMALLLTLLAAIPAWPDGAAWRSEPAGSTLTFSARFEGAEAPGAFQRFNVRLEPGPDGPAGGRLRVEIDVTSADMFSADINEAIAESEWFNLDQYPSATFESAGITWLGENRFEARGPLQLKGVAQTVTVPFEWRSSGNSASMTGRLALRRGDFGIGSGDWADDDSIGQSVEIAFRVDLAPLD